MDVLVHWLRPSIPQSLLAVVARHSVSPVWLRTFGKPDLHAIMHRVLTLEHSLKASPCAEQECRRDVRPCTQGHRFTAATQRGRLIERTLCYAAQRLCPCSRGRGSDLAGATSCIELDYLTSHLKCTSCYRVSGQQFWRHVVTSNQGSSEAHLTLML
jgi:hypothetical protein